MGRLVYTQGELAAMVPYPSLDANKYTRGKLVCVVGSARYTGAACLCARAAERMGAGYTQVFTHREGVPLVRQASSSLVVLPFEELDPSCLAASSPSHPLAVLVGCGFQGNDDDELRLLLQVLDGAQAPVCVDGSALRMLGCEECLSALGRRAEGGFTTVITPHGGEAAQLAKRVSIDPDAVEDLGSSLARAYRSVVVLKGPRTRICDGERFADVATGTPALAKAGTGDVLAGMVGSLLAQGLEAFEASLLAATLHGLAGRAAAEALGVISVTADDLPLYIPQAIDALGAPARF